MATVIPRTTRNLSYWARCGQPVGFSLMGLVCAGFGLLVLVLAGFMHWPLWGITSTTSGLTPLPYTPLVPIAMGFAAFAGQRLAMGVVLSYIALGLLGWPVLANGGGLTYWQQPGFSYLLALAMASGLCGHWACPPKRLKAWWQPLLGVIVGLCVFHIVGAVGLVLQAVVGVVPAAALPGWLTVLSLHTLLPDLVISVLMVVGIAPLARLAITVLL
jgi:biotin transport system substrate-specific component